MHDLNTAFQIIQGLGVVVSAADVNTVQSPDVRTTVMKEATRAILGKLIRELPQSIETQARQPPPESRHQSML
jgi:hypothetical protein